MAADGSNLARLATFALCISMLLVALAHPVSAAPSVVITFPKENDILAGNVTVKGTASGASSVEVKIDAEDTWRPANGTSLWNYVWNASGYSNGYHNVYARGKNGSLTSEIVSVRIFVNNTPPKYIILDVSASPLDTGPGENLTVSGFVEYDTGVALKGTAVTIKVMATNISVTATTGDNGYFIRTFQGPTDADTYTLRVSATDGKLSETRDFELTVTTAYQPDLTVSKIELDPARPMVEETVAICATIENIGEQGASAVAKFYVDGKFLDLEDVQVDELMIVKTVWVADYGEHVIKVVLESVSPADKDDSNNERSIKVTPETRPVVGLKGIVLSNSNPRQGQTLTVMVRIENSGYTGTTGSLVLYDGDVGTGPRIGSKDITIDANQTLNVYMPWVPEQGQHTISAHLTVVGQGEVPEHTMTKDVTVLPPEKKKKEETPGPGIAGILGAILVAAVVVAASRKAREL